ncbi:spermidine synthase [Nocardia alni]|uniref:spermidine synthase n=1 Tax=Nocardia alni TaxID=2815723 RepID=UPI001C22B462|nr:hypothetical protein [Nocardia alni]
MNRLYGRSRLVIDAHDTMMADDRVFVGTYLDDFAVAGLLGPVGEICLLGLAFGGGIRPLLSTAPDAHVTAVDTNRQAIEMCTGLFGMHFPDIGFDAVHADAADYMRFCDKTFDVIAVDLYTPDGHADCVFDERFWSDVLARLAVDGVLMVNVWGVPLYLDPLVGASPQAAVASLLEARVPTLRALPAHDNLTFLACADSEPRAHLESRDLSRSDRACLGLLSARLRVAEIDTKAATLPSELTGLGTFDQVRAETQARWPGLAAAFRAAGGAAGLDPSLCTPRTIIDDPSAAQAITLGLLETDPVSARYVPIVAAESAFRRQYRAEWFGRWVVDEFEDLAQRAPEWFVGTAVPRAMAMAVCPVAPRWEWTDELFDKVEAFAARS